MSLGSFIAENCSPKGHSSNFASGRDKPISRRFLSGRWRGQSESSNDSHSLRKRTARNPSRQTDHPLGDHHPNNPVSVAHLWFWHLGGQIGPESAKRGLYRDGARRRKRPGTRRGDPKDRRHYNRPSGFKLRPENQRQKTSCRGTIPLQFGKISVYSYK